MRAIGWRRALPGALVLLVAGLTAPVQGDAGPEILRGGTDREAPIVVLRGTGPTAFPAPPPAAEPLPWTTAGQHLWLVDPAAGRIVGCRLEPTTRVQEDRVRCTEARAGGVF